jgi:hypothetical protein
VSSSYTNKNSNHKPVLVLGFGVTGFITAFVFATAAGFLGAAGIRCRVTLVLGGDTTFEIFGDIGDFVATFGLLPFREAFGLRWVFWVKSWRNN